MADAGYYRRVDVDMEENADAKSDVDHMRQMSGGPKLKQIKGCRGTGQSRSLLTTLRITDVVTRSERSSDCCDPCEW